MREAIFRGKRVDNGEWVEGAYCAYDSKFDYDKAQFEPNVVYAPSIIAYDDGCLWYRVDPTTVGQYTGLKDKNGKRIFEGDIVFAKDDIWGSPFADGIKGKVVYCETAFFIEPKNVMDTQWLFNECADYEIIGNIHDNPELLEGGANDG